MFERLTGKLSRYIAISVLGLTLVACGGVDETETLGKAKNYVAEKKYNAAMIELKNLLKANANHAEARFILARISLLLGDIKTADKEVRRARDAGWDEAQSERLRAIILLRLGENEKLLDDVPIRDQYPVDVRADLTGLWSAAEMAEGKLDAARSTLALGEQIKDDAVWILQSKIRLLIVDEKLDEAAKQAVRAVELYPEEQDFWLLKASIEEQQKNTEALLASLQQALDLDPPRLMTIRGRQAALGLVQHKMASSDFEGAKEVLVRVLGNFSKDVAANYFGAVLDYRDKELDAATEHLSLVLAAVENHRDSLLLMGNIHYSKGEFEQAAYYLEKATSSGPENLKAQAMLGQAYIHLGQYRDAEERLNRVSRQVKDNPQISALIGISRIQGGKHASGISALEAALIKNPDNQGIRQELAKAYILTGDSEQAIASLESSDLGGESEAKNKALLLMAHLQAGKLDEALSMANEMKRDLPELAISYNLSGAVLETMGKLDDARTDYEKAVSINQNDMLAILNIGRLDFIAGDYDAAAAKFDKVAKDAPDNAAALIGKARVDMARKKVDTAIGWLEQAREANVHDVESRVLLANFYISVRQPQKAVEYIEEAYAITSDDPRVMSVRAATYVDMKHDKAESALESLKQAQPDFPYTWYYDAKHKLGKQDVKGSRASLQRAIQLKPDYLEALVAMGNLERMDGNTRSSIEYALKLQKLHPTRTSGFLLESEALLQDKKADEALEVLQEGLKIATEADVAIRMNKIHQSRGELDKGINIMKAWVADHPEDVTAQFNLAVSYMAKQDFANAISSYEAILDVRPNIPAVMNDLAWLYNETGRPGGLEMARRAHQLVPDNPAIQDTYGWLLIQSGRLANGLATLEDAARGAPESYDIQYHYAYALEKDGQKKQAKKILDKILADNKPFSERKNAESLAATLR